MGWLDKLAGTPQTPAPEPGTQPGQLRLNQTQTPVPSGVSGGQFAASTGSTNPLPPAPAEDLDWEEVGTGKPARVATVFPRLRRLRDDPPSVLTATIKDAAGDVRAIEFDPRPILAMIPEKAWIEMVLNQTAPLLEQHIAAGLKLEPGEILTLDDGWHIPAPRFINHKNRRILVDPLNPSDEAKELYRTERALHLADAIRRHTGWRRKTHKLKTRHGDMIKMGWCEMPDGRFMTISGPQLWEAISTRWAADHGQRMDITEDMYWMSLKEAVRSAEHTERDGNADMDDAIAEILLRRYGMWTEGIVREVAEWWVEYLRQNDKLP